MTSPRRASVLLSDGVEAHVGRGTKVMNTESGRLGRRPTDLSETACAVDVAALLLGAALAFGVGLALMH